MLPLTLWSVQLPPGSDSSRWYTWSTYRQAEGHKWALEMHYSSASAAPTTKVNVVKHSRVDRNNTVWHTMLIMYRTVWMITKPS